MTKIFLDSEIFCARIQRCAIHLSNEVNTGFSLSVNNHQSRGVNTDIYVVITPKDPFRYTQYKVVCKLLELNGIKVDVEGSDKVINIHDLISNLI